VECINETLTPAYGPGSPIISPLFNITQPDSNATSFVFILPINPQTYTEVGKISQGCETQELSCEWQDPHTLAFLWSGCSVSRAKVNMGSGIIGTECTCTHLTVFAIALRSDLHLAPLCHAQSVDYTLIALYSVLLAALVVQLARVGKYMQEKYIPLTQHSMLLLVCVLRIVYLIAKPSIGSLAGLVLLGLLPSAFALSLFIYLLLTWASVQFATFEASPFDRYRIPFIVMTALVFFVVFLLTILVGVNPDMDIVRGGSYVLAILYAVICVMVLVLGLGMRNSISAGDAIREKDWRVVFRCRLLIITVSLSALLFVVACLWVAAVQTDIVTSSAATLATTATFYICDWLSLCVLTWMFSFVVTEARTRDPRFRRKTSEKTSKRSLSKTHVELDE